jgi:hypothetical protein
LRAIRFNRLPGRACPTHFDDDLVKRACRLGEMMFEIYVEENLSVVRKFNERLGL